MEFFRAARVEAVPPGRTKMVELDGRPILLANWNGEIHALDGICPHQYNPFTGAAVWDYLVECPWHHFQYDIRTGENIYPRNVYPPGSPQMARDVRSVRTYAVRVVEGEVFVGIQGKGKRQKSEEGGQS